MDEQTLRLLAAMHLCGLSRQQAAKNVHLSYSAFNQKLRQGRLSPMEQQLLYKLIQQKGQNL